METKLSFVKFNDMLRSHRVALPFSKEILLSLDKLREHIQSQDKGAYLEGKFCYIEVIFSMEGGPKPNFTIWTFINDPYTGDEGDYDQAYRMLREYKISDFFEGINEYVEVAIYNNFFQRDRDSWTRTIQDLKKENSEIALTIQLL